MSKPARITILAITAILLCVILLFLSRPETDIFDPISIAILAAAFIWFWVWLKRRLLPRTESGQMESRG